MVTRLFISCHAFSATSFVSGCKVSAFQQVSKARFHQSHLLQSIPGSVPDDIQGCNSLPQILIQAAQAGA